MNLWWKHFHNAPVYTKIWQTSKFYSKFADLQKIMKKSAYMDETHGRTEKELQNTQNMLDRSFHQ
jgi:hypothetical protein